MLTSAKIDKSMDSIELSVLNCKFPDYSVIAYRFVPTSFHSKIGILGPHPPSINRSGLHRSNKTTFC